MTAILDIVVPVFTVIVAGYVTVRLGVMERAATAVLGRFVLHVAMPALIVATLAGTDLRQAIEPGFLLAYGTGTLLTYGLMLAWFRGGRGDRLDRAAVKALGSAFSNSAFIGYALLLQAFDEPPVAGFAMALMFENLVLMPLVLSVLELGTGQGRAPGARATARLIVARLVTNPLILAITLGLALALFEVRLPPGLSGALGLLGQGAAGVALFFVGATLVGSRLHASLGELGQVALAKLVLHPLLVAAMVLALPAFDPDLQRAAILIAACPMFAIFPVLGARYGHAELASGALLGATALSFLSLSVVLALLL
ncbi:AEC family transporter [Marichromatium sp. AB32]|uniref:AEC family transporter n=1 Tax=Marichromatium sp. AB32 TaxID=2483363 RepID=UPI000F3CB8AE|nr:AEC family transporter [Marichromatium sp. AB32]RNE92482.1 AEC family transporter [Marichromatium sp. AB32]